MKKGIFAIIASFFICLLGTPIMTEASPLAFKTERIAGYDRVETAVKISQKGWDSAQTVFLCEYSDYPDAIAATPFAVDQNAPILLTKGDSIDPRVVAELTRLKPQKIILLGGTACLQPSIEDELDDLAIPWERIGGYDRYETSILLAKRLKSDSLILANGDDFPDALSAANLASNKKIPIVLTSKSLPESVIKHYQEAQPKHLYVIGGEAVVPSANLTKNNFTIGTRLAGFDRYETNAKVVSFMKDSYESNDLFIASGLTFPDALASTVLAAKFKAPLLLTEQNDIPPSVYAYMRGHMKIEPPVSSNNPIKGTITASSGLNLRESPSTTGQVLAIIPQNTTVELIQKQDGWYKTTYQSKTGWISAVYVNPNNPANIDLSVNGTVYILGGTGIISANAQNIIEGKAASKYAENLKNFPPLPSEIKGPDPPANNDPPAGNDPPVGNDPPSPPVYDPSQEVLVNPFEGIPANALAGKKIIIDPGHGGPDTGAIGSQKSYEKHNNLAIALALNDILKQAGATTVLTRNADTAVSKAANYTEIDDLNARVNLANTSNADLFISIHNDSFTNPDVQGTSTYYSAKNPCANESLQLANCIQSSVIDILKTNNRGIKELGFYVLRNTTMPAVLLETAFISNPYEEARLQNPTFRKNVAAAIFRGIYNYYQTPIPQD